MITIIVLLILAGVSIAMLTGENGILTQAQRAKNETENAAINEAETLDGYSDYLNNVTRKFYTANSTINGGEAGTMNPTIPAGFKPIDENGVTWGDGTSAPSTESVNNGLVIEDRSGNQFVWVPVDGENLKYEKHTYADPDENDTVATTEDTGNGYWKTYRYRNYSDWTDNGGNADSVAKYGGFYVARYEAGVPEDANFYASNDGDIYYTDSTNPSKNVTTYAPVSKKGVPTWNYISQVDALEVSSKMYNNSNVKSSLIDGYAWDTISQWLSNFGENVADSTDWGNYLNASFTFDGLYATHIWQNNAWTIATNYSKDEHNKANEERTETATGVAERNIANNIYDFAGNMWEWTTETGKHNGTSDTFAVLRGGAFSSNGFNSSASCRSGGTYNTYAALDFGFRVVLYLE